MANTANIQILRSYANTTPSSLLDGQLAYSFKSNTLFIGSNTYGILSIGDPSTAAIARSAQANTIFTQGVDNTQNSNISLALGAYGAVNATSIVANSTAVVANIALGVLPSMNTNTSIALAGVAAANANITFALGAYGTVNATAIVANSTAVVANQALGIAQSTAIVANIALGVLPSMNTNTTIALAGVAAANANIALALGAYGAINSTAIVANSTAVVANQALGIAQSTATVANIALGVLPSMNTNTSIALAGVAAANANLIINNAINTSQNANIAFAIGAYGAINATAIVANSSGVVANQALGIAQSTAIVANSTATVANIALGVLPSMNTNTSIALAGVNAANANIALALGAYGAVNSTAIVANIALGVLPSMNTNTSIALAGVAAANANLIILNAINTSQNANIAFAIGAYGAVNSTAIVANSSGVVANQALGIAQSTAIVANSTATVANTKFNISGGNITGAVNIQSDLTVTGNVTFLGNATTINTSSLSVVDTLILLGIGNYSTDLLDIGVVGHYNDTQNAHTGIFRDASLKEWMFFDNYTPEVTSNNNVIITDPSFRYANVRANNFKGNLVATTATVNGIELGGFTQSTATLANTISGVAYSTAIVANSSSVVANIALGVLPSMNTNTSIALAGVAAANANIALALGAYGAVNSTAIVANSTAVVANIALGVLPSMNTNTSIALAGVAAANANIALALGAYGAVNSTAIVANSTAVVANIALGVLPSMNTNTSIALAGVAAANANLIINNAINTSQNANIAFAISTYGAINSTAIVANSSGVVANQALGIAQSTAIVANSTAVVANTKASQSGYLPTAIIFANSTGYLSNTSNLTFISSNNTLITGNIIANNITVAGNTVLTEGDLATVTYLPNYITMDPTQVTVPVVGMATSKGFYNFGNVQSISVYGDYDTVANTGFYSVNDEAFANGSPAHVEYIGFTGVTDFNRIVLNINYTAASGHIQDIDVYNYQTNAWDTFGTYSGSGNWQQFALQTIDAIPYIASGNVTIRNYHISSGNTQHRTWIDYVAVEKSITGGQGPKGATGATGATGAAGANTNTANALVITNTTASTSNTTGAIVSYGGLGVSGNVNIGGSNSAVSLKIQGVGAGKAFGYPQLLDIIQDNDNPWGFTVRNAQAGLDKGTTFYVSNDGSPRIGYGTGVNSFRDFIVYSYTSNLISFSTGTSDRLTINSSGDVEVLTGNLYVSGGGVGNLNKGVKFNDGTLQTTAYNPGIDTTQNNNITILQGGLNSANANIAFAIGAYGAVNSTAIVANSTAVVANQALGIAQSTAIVANNSLPNTGSLITVNSTSRLFISNTAAATSNTTGALVVAGGISTNGAIYSTGGSIVINNGATGAGNTGTIYLGDSSFSKTSGSGWSFSGGMSISGSLTLTNSILDLTNGSNTQPIIKLQGASGLGLYFPTGQGSLAFTANSSNALFITAPANTTNYLQISGNTTANSPVVSAQGSDTNISINIVPKGTGTVNIGGNLIFRDGTVQTTAAAATDQYARDTANLAFGILPSMNTNTSIALAGVVAANANLIINNAINTSQNANIAFAIGAYGAVNATSIIANSTAVVANIALGVLPSMNTNTTIALAGVAAANANLIILYAINNSQNSNIITTATVANSTAVVANQALGISQSTAIVANSSAIVANIALGVLPSMNTNTSIALAGVAAANSNITNKLSLTGATTQTVSGNVIISQDLTVGGNLFITGNVNTLNVQQFAITDPLIILGIGNYTSDLKDIGFAGHYNDGVNAHAGLVRDSTTKEWYLFKGYTPELDSNNNVIITDPSFSTANLNANYVKANLITSNVSFVQGGGGSIVFSDGSVQSTAAGGAATDQYARNTANLAFGVLPSMNTNTSIALAGVAAANANIALALGAYGVVNSTAIVANSSGVVANQALGIAQSTAIVANNALPNTGALITVNSASRLYVSNTSNSYSTTNSALYVSGSVGVANSIYVGNRVGFANSNNISVFYQTYNPATSSFDIVLG